MKKILLTVIVTLIILVLAFTLYIYSGSYNISQLSPHNALTMRIISITTQRSVEKRLKGIAVPVLGDSTLIVQGFSHYSEMCVICHGAPGTDPSEMIKGLYPEPPRFYKSDDMPDPDEAFWIIKNGIKMTSMPAFAPTHTDDNIWAITAFMLKKMNNMSPEEYLEWAKKSGNSINEGMN